MHSKLMSIPTMTDSYKVSHHLFLEPGTEYMHSYLESRGGKFTETIFFGLQYYLKEYFTGKVITNENVQIAKKFWAAHFGNDKIFCRDNRYIKKI